MSKSQEQKSIDDIKQQLDEEYQNLSWVEAGWAAIGAETGNKKYDELNKQYLDRNKDNLGIIQSVIQAVGDGASALQFTWEAAQVLPDLVTEINNLRNAKSAATSAGSIEAGCKMIVDAEPLIKKCATVLHSETISASSKENILQSTVIPYLLTPILNKRLNKITKNFQTSETEKINVLDKISPKFIRELSTLGVDLISKALESDLNPKVQEIYKNVKQKNESSQGAILKNIHDIITSDKVKPLLNHDLVQFLKNPDNQKGLVQITENIINNKAQKIVRPELIANTVALLANSSEELIKTVPPAIKAYSQLKENQRWTKINLNMEGLDTETKKELLKGKKPQIVDLVENTKKIIDNLSPVLEKELPQYLDSNKQGILDVLKHPKVMGRIESKGKDPEFIHKALDASTPFLKDALPSITKLASLSLSDSDKIADIIQKAQLIKSFPKEEKSKEEKVKEVKELIGTLIQIKNNNPEISKIIEKDLPELLTKHSSSLGPVVDEFLNKTPKGQELKLDGEKLVKIVSKYAPELIKIADKFSKHEYGKVIVPALKLLSDPKVLGVVAETIVNLGKSKFSKDKEPIGTHTSKVLEERQREMGKSGRRA